MPPIKKSKKSKVILPISQRPHVIEFDKHTKHKTRFFSYLKLSVNDIYEILRKSYDMDVEHLDEFIYIELDRRDDIIRHMVEHLEIVFNIKILNIYANCYKNSFASSRANNISKENIKQNESYCILNATFGDDRLMKFKSYSKPSRCYSIRLENNDLFIYDKWIDYRYTESIPHPCRASLPRIDIKMIAVLPQKSIMPNSRKLEILRDIIAGHDVMMTKYENTEIAKYIKNLGMDEMISY